MQKSALIAEISTKLILLPCISLADTRTTT